jgi:hypothetical protein
MMTQPLHRQLCCKRATPSALLDRPALFFSQETPPTAFSFRLPPAGGLVSSVSRHTHFVFFVFPPITFCIINLSAPGGPGLGTPKTSPPRAQQRMRKSQANSKAPNAGVTRSLPSGVQFPASTRNMRTTPSASCCLQVRTDRGSQRNLLGADGANPPTSCCSSPVFPPNRGSPSGASLLTFPGCPSALAYHH